MRYALVALLFAFAATAQPVTDNDASCDISVAPAATLLLPFFEVNVAAPAGTGETTLFTVTNSGKSPQIARVTLWTDFAYPVVAFNLHLAGYESQSINLFDVLGRGEIRGGSESCGGVLKRLDAPVLRWMQRAFTTGKLSGLPPFPECPAIGTPHANAIGYATIDVVGDCDSSLPTDGEYFSSDIRFDNVLLGDYQQIDGDEDFAQGGTMVHIRAIPEGGTPQSRAGNPLFAVNAPRTFYSVYQHPARPRFDARQPLPSVFAARWIEGGRTGFETYYKIWRESRDNHNSCAAFARNDRETQEIVRFDEEENPEALGPEHFFPGAQLRRLRAPATSISDVASDDFPLNSQWAVAGWMYLNLDDLNPDSHASQSWVTMSMRSEDRFSTDMDAAYLGNGCSAPARVSEASLDGPPIGPAPNERRP